MTDESRFSRLSQSKAAPIAILLIGLALGAFGVLQIVSGDSEVGKLEDELASLQAQTAAVEDDSEAVKSAWRKDDSAFGAFTSKGVLRVGTAWNRAVATGNEALEAFNAGGTPSVAAIKKTESANNVLGRRIEKASQLLSAAAEANSELKDALQAADASAGEE